MLGEQHLRRLGATRELPDLRFTQPVVGDRVFEGECTAREQPLEAPDFARQRIEQVIKLVLVPAGARRRGGMVVAHRHSALLVSGGWCPPATLRRRPS